MAAFICRTCGVQYADAPSPPDACRICTDPRQYVGWEGQRWSTLEELAGDGYRTEIPEPEPGLLGVGVRPSLVIGQRELIVTTDDGNVLWDVPGLWSYPNLVPLDASTIDGIVAQVDDLDFDRIYGGWWDRVVDTDAKAGVHASAARYRRRLARRP